MLHYQTIPVTAFEQNASLIWDDVNQEAAVIDPGGDLPKLKQEADKRGLRLSQIWLTHAHIDHAGGAKALSQELDIPIIGPAQGDLFWIEGLPQQSQMFGFPPSEAFTPTRWLEDGDTLRLGEHSIQVFHTPGHTPGHVVFFAPDLQRVFVGDVLFAGSIGRTDFPQGNHQHLLDSIANKLWPLGDDVVFIPGHGPESTLGHERRTNPFLTKAH